MVGPRSKVMLDYLALFPTIGLRIDAISILCLILVFPYNTKAQELSSIIHLGNSAFRYGSGSGAIAYRRYFNLKGTSNDPLCQIAL